MRRSVCCLVLLLAACTNAPPEARVVSLSVSVGPDSAELDAAYLLPGDPDPLREGGPIGLTWRDASSGEVLASGGLADVRRSIGEPSGEGDPGEGGQFLASGTLHLELEPPRSGLGRLEIVLPDAAGGGHTFTLDVDPVGRAGISSSPLLALPSRGDVAARREALEECPTQETYGAWNPGEVPDPPFPDEPRSVFWGCAETVPVGGSEDPTGRVLVAVYPAAGPDGAWERQAFVDTATEAITGLLERNDFFRRNADRFSFHAIVDPTVLAQSDFGGCNPISSDAWHETLNSGDGGKWYWRTRGAAYGPVPRFEFRGGPNREFQIPDMIRPRFHLGLMNGRCSGFANFPGSMLIVGSRFNAFTGQLGTLPVNGSNLALVGDRIAHEMGHALGGLADEYGFDSGNDPNWSVCIGGEQVGNNAAGDPWPNIDERSCPLADPTCATSDPVRWECMIGAGHECPDHTSGSHSYVRETDSRGNLCEHIVTPCTDSLMRGFAALNPQFDPWADNVMTRALARLVDGGVTPAFSEDACGDVCEGSCDGVACGNDGCDTNCTDSCECAGGVECLTAVGGGVCPEAIDCARTLDLSQAAISDPNDGIDCSDGEQFYRAEQRFLVSRCNPYGRWVPSDCSQAYDDIADCLVAVPRP